MARWRRPRTRTACFQIEADIQGLPRGYRVRPSEQARAMEGEAGRYTSAFTKLLDHLDPSTDPIALQIVLPTSDVACGLSLGIK
jgi:hypothetical protein